MTAYYTAYTDKYYHSVDTLFFGKVKKYTGDVLATYDNYDDAEKKLFEWFEKNPDKKYGYVQYTWEFSGDLHTKKYYYNNPYYKK